MPTYKNRNLGDCQFCVEIDSLLPQKWSKNRKNASNISNFFAKFGQNESENTYFKHFPAYPGDLVIRTGDREIRSVSGRFPDNPGELAYMIFVR